MVEVLPPTDEVDITVNVGSTFIMDFEETIQVDNDPVIPRNLTGYTIRATLRKAYRKEPALKELTVANGGVVESDLVNGKYRLYMSETDTIGLNNNRELDDGVWDLEQVDPAGVVTRMYEGTVTLIPEATT